MSALAQDATIALGDILANTARELEALASKTSAIDEMVGDMLVTGSGATSPPPVALLQDVDLLRQSVDCLHILLHNLSQGQACACVVSRDAAANGVYLERVRKACLGA